MALTPTLIPWNPQAEQRDRRHQQLVANLLNSLILQGVLTQTGFGWTINSTTNISGAGGGGGGIMPQRGADGNSWLTGKGIPSRLIGHVRDLYFDTASGNVYQKRGASPFEVIKWVLLANLRGGKPGKDGINGTSGATGRPGPPGSSGAAGVSGVTNEGASASRPAAGTAGNLWFNDDDSVLERDSGSVWNNFGPVFRFTTPPVAGSWTAFNSPTALVGSNAGLYLAGTPAANVNVLRGYTVAVPTAPYVINAAFLFAFPTISFLQGGLCWTDGTKIVTWGVQTQTAAPQLGMQAIKWTNSTTFSAFYNGVDAVAFSTPIGIDSFLSAGVLFLQIADTGTVRTGSVSADGQNWQTYFSVSNVDFLTATRVGFFQNGNQTLSQGLPFGYSLIHW